MLGRLTGLVVAGAVALVACASEATPPEDEGSRAPGVTTPGTPQPEAEVESSTPQVTTPGGTTDLAELLLPEPDVQAVGGLSDATASDIADAAVYENPDPRGPCGTPIEAVPGADAGRAFTGSSFSALQLVFVDAGEVAGYLDAVEADLRPACGGHESVTNTGAVQQVAEPVPFDLSGVGDRAFGWTTSITVSGQTASAGLAFAVVGERATAVQIFGLRVDADQVEALIRTAVERLAG
jgi:hypothetical protein